MDAILRTPEEMLIIHELLEEADNYFVDEDELEENVSLWIKEKEFYRPSTNITLSKKLEPGAYIVEFDRELGFLCKKLDSASDQLFVFSDSITEKLSEEIDLFWTKKDLYKEHNLVHKRGILLEGYPGTGKSSIITQLSESVITQGGVIFKVTGYRNLEQYIQFIRNSFRRIQPTTPIITILEDIDQYENVEAELLDFLDGKTSINHHVVIATSNNTEEIPDTLLRPSRLDLKIEVEMPTEKTREEYFRFKKVDEEYILRLVKESSGCSLADLKEIYVCMFLLDYTLEDAITKVKTPKTKKNYLFNSPGKARIGL